jgi:hypothetical protein
MDNYDKRENDARFAELWDHAGVTARHQKQPENTCGEWKVELDRLIGALGTGILVALVGNRGTGKTQLGAECIRRQCKALKSCLYTTAMDIFISIKDCYKRTSLKGMPYSGSSHSVCW